MVRCRCFDFVRLVLIVFTLPLAASASAEEAVLFEERFEGELDPSWKWLKQKDGAWRIKDGALHMRVGEQDNLLARDVPASSSGPYAIEVTLTSLPAPTRQYEQGGLFWHHDDKLAFKYVKELIDGKTYIYPGDKLMESDTVQLRIEVRGDKFKALFRPAAKGEYQAAFQGDLPNRGEGQQQIAIMGYNGPADAEHWMQFDDFRIVKLND